MFAKFKVFCNKRVYHDEIICCLFGHIGHIMKLVTNSHIYDGAWKGLNNLAVELFCCLFLGHHRKCVTGVMVSRSESRDIRLSYLVIILES